MDKNQTIWCFEDTNVVAELILENENSKVFQLEDLSNIGFSGTPINLIKKEFPNWNMPIGEQLNHTFVLIKDETPILEYDYERH